MWVERAELERSIQRTIRTNPVTALIGPRYCGKTAVARHIAAAARVEYFDWSMWCASSARSSRGRRC